MQALNSRMSAALARYNFDAALAISMENVFYLSGAWITTQKAIPDRLAIVVWPREGQPALITCTIEESLARRDSRIADIHGYVEFQTSPIEKLAEVLRAMGLERARLGFERKYLTADYYDELRERLPDAHWSGSDRLFDEVRMIKSDDEIARLARAAQTTDAVIWEAFQSARVGRTEKEIGDWMQMQLLARGADEGIFMVLGAGDSAGLAHPSPRARALQDGDVLRVDFGGLFGGYFSDLARSMVVGRATAQQRDAYARGARGKAASISTCRTSATASASACTSTRCSARATRRRWRRTWRWPSSPSAATPMALSSISRTSSLSARTARKLSRAPDGGNDWLRAVNSKPAMRVTPIQESLSCLG
ncbi:MAG: aminopeptidase P family protein [Chloroflexi bacterium]|nr:aminopeptidase P family protein [Chloroflexota bacterium]